MPRDNHNATLVQRINLHEDLARFFIKYNDHEVPEFEPGQFATLGLPDPTPVDPNSPAARSGRGPKLIRRAYSVASAATQKDTLEFYIVRVDDGRLTNPLWSLTEGDTLFMNPRLGGHFTLEGVPAPGDGKPAKHVITVGTGTGLAPFRSMYLTYRDRSRWNEFVLLDGCRVARDLGYREELEAFAHTDPHFTYLPTVTREPADSDYDGYRGRVTDLLTPEAFESAAGFTLSPETCHVFLCGNPQMIDQVEADLVERGFVVQDRKHPDGNLHFERYW